MILTLPAVVLALGWQVVHPEITGFNQIFTAQVSCPTVCDSAAVRSAIGWKRLLGALTFITYIGRQVFLFSSLRR